MHDIVIQLLNGLVVGSSLALVASGLALVSSRQNASSSHKAAMTV